MKKLILNPFLYIKGGRYEGSHFNIHERASSGLSKNRLRFDSRFDFRSPSYGAHNVADFRHFQTELSEHIMDEPWSLAIYPATNMFIWTGVVYHG